MAYKALPPQAELRQLFDYDAKSGELRWKQRDVSLFADKVQSAAHNAAIWNAKNAGRVACSMTANGYLETTVFRRRLLAHRVIWKWVHGVDPDDIDHINGDPADNRLENLRNVSHVTNGRNLSRRSNNTSGVTGVSRHKDKWVARICPSRRTIYLGLYDSFDDAVAARRAAEVKLGFHPNHGRN
jgi:hypothetical protein